MKFFRSAPADWLIVGLANPGKQYERTRHNIGGDVATELAKEWDLGRGTKKYAGLMFAGRAVPGGPHVVALVPGTYMNESGRSVGPARGALKLDAEHVIVLHDEIDLPFGDVQTKLGGGLAGHNGLKSIRQALGTNEFWRVRIGVGRPPNSDPETVSSYVLSRFREDALALEELRSRAIEAVEQIVLEQSS